jgi:DNA repair protein RadC
MSLFTRYIGIDYSGARTPTCSLPGLRVYQAGAGSEPTEVPPPPSPRKYWTRRGLAEWLVGALRNSEPTIVGIDHGFSFPLAYFERHGIARNWNAFLEDFCAHWPTHEDHVYVDFVRDGVCGNGAARGGDARWRRLTEQRTRGARSVFHFDAQGSVAKSTHAGLPWLRYLRNELGGEVHIWPFDGWGVPQGRSAIVEVYPSLWRKGYPSNTRNPHQQDAYVICRWLQDTDRAGALNGYLRPELPADVRAVAEFEGWILGVLDDKRSSSGGAVKPIKQLPKGDRPREKMQAKGPQVLTDQELLAVLLGRGTAELDVMAMAARILEVLGENKEHPDLEKLQKIKGVGPARASLVAAALEFARRRIRPEGLKVTFSTDVIPLIRHYADRKQEHFLCISLNGANEVIATRVITVGLANRTQVHPREVFADALTDRASAVILAHNHPSGGVQPSKEDIGITQQLREAGTTLGIRVLDHIIFNQRAHFSFAESNITY